MSARFPCPIRPSHSHPLFMCGSLADTMNSPQINHLFCIDEAASIPIRARARASDRWNAQKSTQSSTSPAIAPKSKQNNPYPLSKSCTRMRSQLKSRVQSVYENIKVKSVATFSPRFGDPTASLHARALRGDVPTWPGGDTWRLPTPGLVRCVSVNWPAFVFRCCFYGVFFSLSSRISDNDSVFFVPLVRMGHEQVDLETLPPAEEEDDDDYQMVTCELEAAEALAGLAGVLGSGEAVVTVTPSRSSQDQPIADRPFCGYASTTITSPERTETIVKNVPSQLCSTTCQPNPGSKFRQKLTEAEKEARKLRRVLANRESARQTIRRRQAMYLELTRKAADMLEENENLKKKKEVAVEEYNLLKGRNEFLKEQLAKIKQAEAGEKQEEPKTTSLPEKSCPATGAQTFFHNQPSMVPFFWPSILPSSDLVQFHCASGSNIISSQQYAIPHRDIHQGQDNSTGVNTGQGTPVIVLPVPWLLPCLTHSSMLHSNSCINDKQNTQPHSSSSGSETRLHEDKNQSSLSYNTRAEARNSTKAGSAHGAGFNMPTDSGGHYTTSHPRGVVSVPELFSSVRPQEGHRPTKTSRVENTFGVDVVSATHSMLQKNQDTIIGLQKKPEDIFAATEARRRRKELMRLRNINCHHRVRHPHSPSSVKLEEALLLLEHCFLSENQMFDSPTSWTSSGSRNPFLDCTGNISRLGESLYLYLFPKGQHPHSPSPVKLQEALL
ncbi:hypothetical protein Salat_2347900 [Sesamum alatum]|uniref:BZIP domain-containing protein n=1 Tax=Sesamum alatum TaxID=300844 RepID=A0AAE1XWL6_9LAMI|nr:hypothetical protein Salat_2347900 [Sesamum alatum]